MALCLLPDAPDSSERRKCFVVSPMVKLNALVCMCVCVSHRGLHAGVGDVAADRHVLAVFAAVKGHLSVVALRDGLLPACALHTVHMDWTGTYRRRAGSESRLIRMCPTDHKPHAKRQPTHMVHKRL